MCAHRSEFGHVYLLKLLYVNDCVVWRSYGLAVKPSFLFFFLSFFSFCICLDFNLSGSFCTVLRIVP